MKNQKIQVCRAIAIMAVIATHITIQNPLLGVGIRSFVNFAVGLFIFLSGILTDINAPWKKLYAKRLSRVLIPYIVWTAISVWYHQTSFLYNLVTGSYFYYVFVYAELVLLTPLIQKLIKSEFWRFGFIITPLAIFIEYIFCFMKNDIPFPWYLENPFVWFQFYYLGMCLKCGKLQIHGKKRHYILVYTLSIGVQLFESYLWYMFGNLTMASTQIKFSAVLTTTIFCIIAYLWIKEGDSSKFGILTKIGDCSFAMYLSHGLLISVFSQFDRWWTLIFVEHFIMILLADFLLMYILSRLLPNNILRWIGI